MLARERRWALPVGALTLAAAALSIAGTVVFAQIGGAAGNAEFLRNVDQHRDAELISMVLQGLGAALLAAPLAYLFRAAEARAPRMRGALIGVVVVAPLFLALFYALAGASALHAATDFAAKGIAGNGDRADKVAETALRDAPLQGLAAGFGLGGKLGFLVAMVYTSLHAMRTGLLTRFWGSLGIALGAVSFLFPQFVLLWFVYLGLLIAGWLPRGRPPAWAAGEAIPWPTPGEQLAGREDEPERRG